MVCCVKHSFCNSSAFQCVIVVATEYSKENPLSLMQQRSSTRLETTSLSTDVALWFSLEYSVATTYPAISKAELLLRLYFFIDEMWYIDSICGTIEKENNESIKLEEQEVCVMTAIRQTAFKELERIPEDKVVFILQIMQGVNGLYTDNQQEREEALAQLELFRKKGTVTDDDAELASYRNEKYGK